MQKLKYLGIHQYESIGGFMSKPATAHATYPEEYSSQI